MNFLSDSQSEQQNSSERGLQKIQAQWRQIKQSRQYETKSVTNAMYQQQQRNLQTRLTMTEKQLAKAKENTVLLMKRLNQAEEQAEIKNFEVVQQRKIKQEQKSEIQQLKVLLIEKNITHKSQKFGEIFDKQNIPRNNPEKQNLMKKLQMKQKQVDRLCLKIKSLELDLHNNEIQIKKLQESNTNYRKQLVQSQTAINDAYLGCQSNGAELLELNQAKKTIQRLMKLLKNTQQYKNFPTFAEQSKQVHFLKNITKRLKNNTLLYKITQKKKLCACMDIKIDQKLLWTPEASYKILLQMKMKYDSLSQNCIQQVLFQLNKIWLARQQAHVRRIKSGHQTEVVKLKKKGEQKYDAVLARKQIQRLKKQLTGVRSSCVSSTKHKKNVLMTNLKNVGQYEDQLKIREKQNKLLHQRIRLLQNEADCSDRVLYLEGALWVIEKVLKQLEENDQDLRDFENQFRDRIEGNLSNEEWIRGFKEFFETITELNSSLVQRLFIMRDSTQKKVNGDKTISNTIDMNKRY